MHMTDQERWLQLTLAAHQTIPTTLCWRINSGYLRATTRRERADSYTLGIWGPSEIVIPELVRIDAIELHALSSVMISEFSPTEDERTVFSSTHLQQISMLLQLAKIRPVEARILNLLMWLGERFGSKTSQGVAVPIDAMNLTHRQLADLGCVSRVTVTKALGSFRQQGWLARSGACELMTHSGIHAYKTML